MVFKRGFICKFRSLCLSLPLGLRTGLSEAWEKRSGRFLLRFLVPFYQTTNRFLRIMGEYAKGSANICTPPSLAHSHSRGIASKNRPLDG